MSKRDKVFISYSHEDVSWLLRLRVHLRPLEREHSIEFWDDTRIEPGSKWRQEIKAALDHARVAILLISADFLASDFIINNELPPLLEAAEKEGAVILPVIISPSRFLKTQLSQFQAINNPIYPLIKLTKGEQEDVFVNISERIEVSFDNAGMSEIRTRAEELNGHSDLQKELDGARRHPKQWDISASGYPAFSLVHKPQHEFFEAAPVHVDKLDKKAKVSAGILNLKKFTMLFWVNITEAFSWSDNNRYLFAYTSDVRDENRHPNGFYMGIAGNEQSWRLVIKGPDAANVTKISFPHSPALVGLKLISVRWSSYTKTLELDIDAGEVLAERRTIEPDFWPQATQHEQMHIGGWFDTWKGGLSLLRFYHLRIYDVRLSDEELKHLYHEERADVASKFTPR